MKSKILKSKFVTLLLIVVMVITMTNEGKITQVYASNTYNTERFTLDGVNWGLFVSEMSSFRVRIEQDDPVETVVFPTKQDLIDQLYFKEAYENAFQREQTVFYYDVMSEDKERFNKVKELVIKQDYISFPGIKDTNYYQNKPSNLVFNDNTSIERILVDTTDNKNKQNEQNGKNGKNGFELREATFHNMQALEEVEINVGKNNTIVLDGSTFAMCPKLKRVTLTAGKINFMGSYNFAGCTSLEQVYINGDLTINGNQDFAGCKSLQLVNLSGSATFNGKGTFPASSKFVDDSVINFGGPVNVSVTDQTVSRETDVASQLEKNNGIIVPVSNSVFSSQGTIDTISINGENSDLGSDFLTGVTVTNFNIEGKNTTFSDASVVNSEIEGISFNAPCEFGNNAAFVDDCIEKLYFNNVEMSGTIAGGKTTVDSTYFNNTDVFHNKIKGMEQIKGFSFGDAIYKDIYFLNQDINAISNVPYPAKGKETTTVYAYGGNISKYENDATLLTSEDMFRKWTGDHYENIVTIDEKNSIMGEDGTVDVNLYLLNGETEVTYPINNMNIFATYNQTAIEKDHELAAKNLANGKMKLSYTTDKNASTNFNYKVLEKIDANKVTGKDQYVYKDGKDCYVACQKDSLTLTANDEPYRYFIQAAGKIYPLNIKVEKNELDSIKVRTVSGGALQVTKGALIDSDVHKSQLIVTGVMKNKDEVLMEPSQYVIFKSNGTTVAEGDSLYYIECAKKIATIMPEVHSGNVTSFQTECKKKQMAEGEELTLEDVKIINIGFDNPAEPLSNEVKGDVKFLQDGVEKDTYTIRKGTNEIAIVYEGHTEDKACIITGIDNTVESFRVIEPSREIELYKKTTLNVNEVSLTDVVFKDSSLAKVNLVKKGFTFLVDGEEMDTVELKEGKNVIGVKYNGCEIQDALVVNALPTTVESIDANYVGPAVYEGGEVSTDTSVLFVTVHYAHPTTASVLVTNIDITLGTYEIVPGADNNIYVYYKGVRSQNPIKVLGLANPVVGIQKIVYTGDKTEGKKIDPNEFYVEVAYASGKTENSVENPELLKQLSFSSTEFNAEEDVIQVRYKDTVSANYSVSKNDMVTEISVEETMAPPTAEVTKQPIITPTKTPVNSATPEATKSATDANLATDTLQTPAATVKPTVPVATAVTTATTATEQPVISVKEGDVRTVAGVNYKINTISGNYGTVSVVGYDKSAGKVKLAAAIDVDGVLFDVTKIEKNAFKNCTKLTGSVLINKNVTSIEDSAFYGCKNITKVVFGSGVNRIGSKSFYGCKKLKTLQFMSDRLKKIGSKAFKGIAKKYSIKTASKYKAKYKKLVKKAK